MCLCLPPNTLGWHSHFCLHVVALIAVQRVTDDRTHASSPSSGNVDAYFCPRARFLNASNCIYRPFHPYRCQGPHLELVSFGLLYSGLVSSPPILQVNSRSIHQPVWHLIYSANTTICRNSVVEVSSIR